VADNPLKDFTAPNALGWNGIRVRRPAGVYEHQECSSESVRFEVSNLESVPDLVTEMFEIPL